MPDRTIDPRARSLCARARVLVLLGTVALCAGVAQVHWVLAQAARDVQYEDFISHRNATVVWYALMVAAVVVLCRLTRQWCEPAWRGRWGWVAGLAVLVVAAGWLRLHRLDELPPGLWVDEALNGVQAVQIAQAGRPLVALPPEDVRTGLGAGYVDVAALVFAFGDPDDGPYALRAVAAAIGTLGVAALAWLAGTLFGLRVALAATAWLAVSQWHLNYSRWGEMPIMSSVIETAIAVCLVIGFRARGWRSWAGFLGAGLGAGAGVYTYQTFRLFVVLAGVACAVLALRHRRAIAAHAGPIVAAGVLALLVAAPMLRYAATAPAEFGERAQGTLILGRADWREQLAESLPRSLLAFQFVGDDNPRHNLPFAPLLGGVAALLAPVGLAVCLARWRSLPYALVLLWFAIALVPGVITLESPHASRLLDAIVPVALMIGIGVDFLLGVLEAAVPGRLGLAAGAAAALLAFALSAREEYRTYFIERPLSPDFIAAFHPWESAPARYLAEHAPSATVFLDPTTYHSPVTQFVARRYLAAMPNDVRILRVQHDFPPPEPLSRDALYLLPRAYAPLAAAIQAMWAEAHCDEVRDPFGRLDMAACRVPLAALARTDGTPARWPYGLRGRFYDSADGSGAPRAEAMLALPFCEYSLEEPPLERFRFAEWDGFIDIPEAGEYFFRLHPDSTTLTIDGRPIIEHAGARAFGGGSEGRATLPAGRLPIRITLDPGPTGRYFMWFVWEPPHRELEIVPSAALRPPD